MIGAATVVGGVGSGIGAGALIGAAGAAIPLQTRGLIATVGAAALAVLAQFGRQWLLQIDRETEQGLLGLGPLKWGLSNGAFLGLGFTSRLGTWCWYAIPYFTLISGSLVAGASIWGLYAFARLGIAVALAFYMRADPSDHRMAVISARVLDLRPRLIRYLSVLFSATMIVALFVAGL